MTTRCIASAILFVVLYGVVTGAADAQAPAQNRLVTRTEAGSIRGRVLATGTDLPLRNARIQATSDVGSAQPVFTDADGRFVIASLVPGRYRVAVTKPGFLPTNAGAEGVGADAQGNVYVGEVTTMALKKYARNSR